MTHRVLLSSLMAALVLVLPSPARCQEGLPDVDAALASPSAAIREQALDRLIASEDARPELLPQFARLLDDPDLAVAGKAATALALRGEQAWPTLAQLLAGGSPQQRWGATVAIYQARADIRPFLPALTRQLAQPDASLIRASLAALAHLQTDAAPALPALRSLLAHEEMEIRWAALSTLAAIGPAAADGVPDIEPFLRDTSAELRLAAAGAMRRIRTPVPIAASRLAAHLAWLRERVPALMGEHHVPGVSIAVIQQGELRWSQGFGVADARTGSPVTIDTVFEACSKPILALVAMQLVQAGRLDLDRPLVEYLGHDYLPDQPVHRRITARMALTHRTGLSNWRMGYDDMGGPLPLLYPPGPTTPTPARASCFCSARWRRSPVGRSTAWRGSACSRRSASRARASCGPRSSSRISRAVTARTDRSRSGRATARPTVRTRSTRRRRNTPG